MSRAKHLTLETPTGTREYRVLRAKPSAPFWIVSLEGVEGRDAAEALQRAVVYLREDELPPAAPGEVYLYQLEGARAVTSAGEELGLIAGSFETGANIVLVVRGPKGEYMLPFIEDVVREIDLPNRRVVIELLEGLEPS